MVGAQHDGVIRRKEEINADLPHLRSDSPKRHTQFRQPDGSLYVEEVFGTHGFSGNESILYHINSPARITGVDFVPATPPEVWNPCGQHHHHLRTGDILRAAMPFRAGSV